MPNNFDNYDLRSEEVQDILTAVPNWTIRSGSALLCLLIVLFIFMSWFIKYPDTIESQAIITTVSPPQKKYAKSSGKLQQLLIKNNELVFPDTDLAVIENSANYNDVQILKQIIDTLIPNKTTFNFPINDIPLLFLGEIDASYSIFENNYILYSINREQQPFNNNELSYKNSASELQIRLNTLKHQKKIQQNELIFQRKDVVRYKQLFDNGIVSEQEYENKQLHFLQSERNYRSITTNISQMRERIKNSDYDFSIESINNNSYRTTLFKNVIQSFNQLKKAIYDWEYKHVLKSNISGSVAFLNIWSTNQHINSGDQLFTIIPTKNNTIIAKLSVPALNSGKIKIGQKVNIKLNNFPELEYGVLKGYITSISEITTKNGHYIIDVSLPNNLITSYKKTINFKHEMSGKAEIITDDLRLSDRFLGRLMSIINN